MELHEKRTLVVVQLLALGALAVVLQLNDHSGGLSVVVEWNDSLKALSVVVEWNDSLQELTVGMKWPLFGLLVPLECQELGVPVLLRNLIEVNVATFFYGCLLLSLTNRHNFPTGLITLFFPSKSLQVFPYAVTVNSLACLGCFLPLCRP